VTRPARVVIIGGGITGLAAAYALSTRAMPGGAPLLCTVIERDSRLGGKIRTEHLHHCVIETGPDSFLTSKPAAVELCRRLGLEDRLIGTLPGRAVFVAARGRLHPLPPGLALGIPTEILPVVRTGLLSPAAKARMAWDLVLPRRAPDGDETVGAFVARRLGRAAADRLVGPLLAGIYAGDAGALSLLATFPQLRQWEMEHRSLILAAMRQRRRATPEGAQRPMFIGLAGGLGGMVTAVREAMPDVRMIAGQPVARIDRAAAAGAGYTIRLSDGRMVSADAVLLATPAYATADLLEPLAPQVAALLRGIPYASTAAVTLGYRRSDIAHPLAGHGFVVARNEPFAITACTWVSSKWPDRAPSDLALLRCYLGSAGRDAIVTEDDDRLTAAARSDLARLMGIEATPVFAHVARWPQAMPQYLPGHLDRLDAIEVGLRALSGVAVAGAGYRGIGIPDCIRQGTEAAVRLAETLDAERAEPAVR
jgi:oxygen-dependent protoporphyrinogen oxidase